MKAVICTKYGGPEVLQIQEVEKPIPKDNEILIKIHATTVTSGDYRIRKADPTLIRLIFGFMKPRNPILGGNLAGEIIETGKDVTQFKKGDKIFGSTGMSFGSYAEYKALPENAVISKIPPKMNYETAAAILFGGLTANSFLRKANIKKGQKVLIYGASGAVGTSAVQIAKYLGAEVTGVCSTGNIKLVRSLGARKVIDYTKKDFSKDKEQYGIVYETVGKSSISNGKKILKNDGIYIAGASGLMKGFAQLLWTGITSKKKVITGVALETRETLEFLKKMFEENKLNPVIDNTYTLEEIPKAHEYAEKGHKKGNVVITIK